MQSFLIINITTELKERIRKYNLSLKIFVFFVLSVVKKIQILYASTARDICADHEVFL